MQKGCHVDVRYWPKADIAASTSSHGGLGDMLSLALTVAVCLLVLCSTVRRAE